MQFQHVRGHSFLLCPPNHPMEFSTVARSHGPNLRPKKKHGGSNCCTCLQTHLQRSGQVLGGDVVEPGSKHVATIRICMKLNHILQYIFIKITLLSVFHSHSQVIHRPPRLNLSLISMESLTGRENIHFTLLFINSFSFPFIELDFSHP